MLRRAANTNTQRALWGKVAVSWLHILLHPPTHPPTHTHTHTHRSQFSSWPGPFTQHTAANRKPDVSPTFSLVSQPHCRSTHDLRILFVQVKQNNATFIFSDRAGTISIDYKESNLFNYEERNLLTDWWKELATRRPMGGGRTAAAFLQSESLSPSVILYVAEFSALTNLQSWALAF